MGFDEGNRAIPPARARTHSAHRHRAALACAEAHAYAARDAKWLFCFRRAAAQAMPAGRGRPRAAQSLLLATGSTRSSPPRPAPPRPAGVVLCCVVLRSLLAVFGCQRSCHWPTRCVSRRCGMGAAPTSRSAPRRCAVYRRALPRLMGERTVRTIRNGGGTARARALQHVPNGQGLCRRRRCRTSTIPCASPVRASTCPTRPRKCQATRARTGL